MGTERYKVQVYLESENSERFTAWKKQRGIEKDSAALNELLKEYFSPGEKNPKIDVGQIEEKILERVKTELLPQEAEEWVECLERDLRAELMKKLPTKTAVENAITEIADSKLVEYRQALEAATQAMDVNLSRLGQSIEVLRIDVKKLDEEVNHLSDGNGILDLKVQEIYQELQELKARLNGHFTEQTSPEQLPAAPGLQEAIASVPDESLNQRALGARFGINPGTIQKKREKLDVAAFGEWSKSKDPDAIAWRYDPQKKAYSPLI